MRNIIATLALSAAVAATGMPLTIAPASAQGFELRIDPDGRGPDIRLRADDGRDRYDRYEGRRYMERSARCTEGRALDKAARMGIRRAAISSAGRRTIEVTGRSRGERVFVTFGRSPSCPVLG